MGHERRLPLCNFGVAACCFAFEGGESRESEVGQSFGRACWRDVDCGGEEGDTEDGQHRA